MPMPIQTCPWKIGVWPLALAMLLHAIPWWMMHRGGRGEGLHDAVMRFREIRLLARSPERELVPAILSPSPEPLVPTSEILPKPMRPPADHAPSPKPVAVDAPASAQTVPDPVPSIAQDPGNGHPPGWIFDPESYVPAEDLDEPPQLVGEWVLNEAAVPKLAKDRPSRIRVVVRMWVSAEGHVDIYQILDADPVVPWLEALLKDLDKSTLKPAVRDGQPVGSSWMVEMDLDLSAGL